MRSRTRESAGSSLAERLVHFRGMNPLVLGIAPGAVATARGVAEALDGDLDVVLARKIGAPGNPDYPAGAVGETGEIVMNPAAVDISIDDGYMSREANVQLGTIRARRARLAAVRASVDPAERIVIVVDDGAVTGSTMLAALHAVRRRKPKWLVAAMAVAPPEIAQRIAAVADDVVCLHTPEEFPSVARFFDDFGPVTDDEVVATLREFRRGRAPARKHPADDASAPVPAGA